MTLVLVPGMFGLDAYNNNRWDPDVLEEAGVDFITAYICQRNALTAGKIITVDQWARLGRFKRILNYEWYPERCIEPGRAAGDAVEVLRLMAQGRPCEVVVVSCDTDVGGMFASTPAQGPRPSRPQQLGVCVQELVVWQAALRTAGVKLGVYGGGWLFRWLIDNGPRYGLDVSTILWWQTGIAWSNLSTGGKYIAPETHIVQGGGQVYGDVLSDNNYCVRTWMSSASGPGGNVGGGGNGGGGGQLPPPVTDPGPDPDPNNNVEEDDMTPTRFLRSDGAQFILGPNGDDMIPVSPPYADACHLAGGKLVGPSEELDSKLGLLVQHYSPRDLAGMTMKKVDESTAAIMANVDAIPAHVGGAPAPAPTRFEIHGVVTGDITAV